MEQVIDGLDYYKVVVLIYLICYAKAAQLCVGYIFLVRRNPLLIGESHVLAVFSRNFQTILQL